MRGFWETARRPEGKKRKGKKPEKGQNGKGGRNAITHTKKGQVGCRLEQVM